MSLGFKAVSYVLAAPGNDFFSLPLSDAAADGKPVPSLFLSSRSAGSMTYEPSAGNPVRDSWIRARGFDPGGVLAVTLAHSRIVRTAAVPGELQGVEADGILTANRGSCAVVTVADCMPIFLYDPGSGAFGVLHSGWKGTGILERAFEVLKSEWGANPRDVLVTFGPCIGSCCYPVGDERARVFSDEFGPEAVTVIDGTPRLDLLAANLALARRCGAHSVRYAETCTSCDGRLGSFRRQGAQAFTRMAAAIGFPSGEHA